MTDSKLDLKQISERYFAAWEARDPDAIVALHTEDTRFWSHLGIEPVSGRERVRETFAELFERFPEFSFETYRVLYGADFWVLDWALIFRPEGSEETARFDCLDVVNVSPDGLVARKDTFIDMVQLQGAMPATDVASEAAAMNKEVASA
jgi:ketosteroid isomerase-like protein